MKIEQFLLVVNRRKSSILFLCRAILHKFMGGGYLKLSIYLLLQCCLFAWGIGDIHAETVQLPRNSTQSFIVTGIEDIQSFLERCPTNDPVYNLLKQDFEILIDGQPITPIICNEPISAMPIDQYTDELITLQTLRTAYYMSIGTEGKLPWTQKDLYSWMASNISGVNIKTSPGQLYCCDYMNGKYYFSESRQDNYNRDIKRTWPGIAITLDYFAHEIRHSDAGAPGHTFGCIAFPLQTGFWGCDATYDLNNLGSYGVQYWLESSWATGYLNIGISCAPNDTAYQYATWNAACANNFRDRFVNNVPPIITATQPYGGPCVSVVILTVTKLGGGFGDISADTGAITWDGNTGTVSYNSGTTVKLTASASAGSTFSGWTGCDSSNGSQCAVTMNTNKNVKADFALTSCAATLDTDLNLHIPIINYNSGALYLWADFAYVPTNDGNIIFTVTNAGYANQADFSNCQPSTLTADLSVLHIPLIDYNSGALSLWADFQYAHDLIFTLTGAGQN